MINVDTINMQKKRNRVKGNWKKKKREKFFIFYFDIKYYNDKKSEKISAMFFVVWL